MGLVQESFLSSLFSGHIFCLLLLFHQKPSMISFTTLLCACSFITVKAFVADVVLYVVVVKVEIAVFVFLQEVSVIIHLLVAIAVYLISIRFYNTMWILVLNAILLVRNEPESVYRHFVSRSRPQLIKQRLMQDKITPLLTQILESLKTLCRYFRDRWKIMSRSIPDCIQTMPRSVQESSAAWCRLWPLWIFKTNLKICPRSVRDTLKTSCTPRC